MHAQSLGLIFTRLDRGEGKDLSLDECPREQLEKEVGDGFHLHFNVHTNLLFIF